MTLGDQHCTEQHSIYMHDCGDACVLPTPTRTPTAWWLDTDELHEAEVVRWVDGVHHVAYDDGDTSDWSLYWESGAEGFVLA